MWSRQHNPGIRANLKAQRKEIIIITIVIIKANI